MRTAQQTKNESSISYLNEIILDILKIILSHLDLKSIGNLRSTSKKLKEKTDSLLPAYINKSVVDTLFTKENLSKILHDFYSSEPQRFAPLPAMPIIGDEEVDKIKTAIPGVTNLSTYALLRQFPETRIEESQVLNYLTMKNLIKNQSMLAVINIIFHRINFYMENYSFSNEEEGLLFKEHLTEFIRALIACSHGEKNLKDILLFIDNKLFCFILNVFHREIKKYKKDSWNRFLVAFEAFVIQSFHLQFLHGILTTAQVHNFLKLYQFERNYEANRFYRSLFGMKTANHLNFDILRVIANFCKAYESERAGGIPIYMKNFCSYLIPAITQYYYVDHVIVSAEELGDVFESIGLPQLNLENLPRLELFSECLRILYEGKIFGVSPSEPASLMFHFLWNFIAICELPQNSEWLLRAVHAMTIVLRKKVTPLSEIKFLFKMAKIYENINGIAWALVIVEENKQSPVTAAAVMSWSEQFPSLIPKKYHAEVEMGELVYLFTKAVLALWTMGLLDNKGKVVNQLKSLIFEKNQLRESILLHLATCFEEKISLPEIGRYFLNKTPNELITIDVQLMRLACFLVGKKVIPQVINFSDFFDWFAGLEELFYFDKTFRNLVNNINFKVVTKEFFCTLAEFVKKYPEYVAKIERNELLSLALEIYLLDLSLGKTVSLESILHENIELSLKKVQGLPRIVDDQRGEEGKPEEDPSSTVFGMTPF